MSIHAEITIPAAPRQVYELLTNGTLFGTATGMPAEMTDQPGDPFTLFGGRIEGRQVELVPSERVVQAWRFGAEHPTPWEPGAYSTVRFLLEPAETGTRIVIDHTGIPAEWVEHIESGYPTFYKQPITQYFANQ
jgi:activator of HSP90 ATPase